MIIMYRTNEGFEGNIVSLDFQTPAAAVEAWLAVGAENGGADLACLEIDQALLTTDVLADLVLYYADPSHFYVAEVDGVLSLIQAGV